MPGREVNLLDNHGSLPDGWERSETAAGIPYYLNHNDGTTDWDHPITSQVYSEMDGINDIKYGTYRTAMKLRSIQKMTHLNDVDQFILQRSLDELGLGPGTTHNNEVLSVHDLEALLVSIFQLASRERDKFIQVEGCVELSLSFLLKCLDSGRTGAVRIRSVKIILAALSSSSLAERYEFMFRQVSPVNGIGISHSNLKILLQDLLLLIAVVNESSTFKAETIDSAVESCWEMSNNQPTDTVSLEEFVHWMMREPVCTVWLPTLHRLATAETIKHEAKCSKCKIFPIVGFRYRCLKCTNVDLCQNCYWTQKTLKNHKLTHPTREYCLATTTGDDVRDFVKQMKNKITRRYRHRPLKQNYLDYPINTRDDGNRIPDICPVFENVHTRVNLLASRLQELEGGADQVDGAPSSREISRPEPQPQTMAESPPLQLPPVSLPLAMAESPPLQLPPPPLAMISPIAPPTVSQRSDLEARLKLESRIIDLQKKCQDETATRRKLERDHAELSRSKLEDQESKCELEQKIHDLQESNQLLKEKVTTLLATPPLIKTVRVPVPVNAPIQSPQTSITGVRTLGVNTPNQFLESRDAWNSSLLGEEEEMEAILKEILAAFPKDTNKNIATTANSKVFKAAAAVGESLTSLVSEMH